MQMGYKDLRTKHEHDVVNLYGFSSAKKMASVLVRTETGFRLYNKVPITANTNHPASMCYYLLAVHPPLPGFVDRSHCRADHQPHQHLQGAAEIVLQSATRVLNADGDAVPLGEDQRAELEAIITQVQNVEGTRLEGNSPAVWW